MMSLESAVASSKPSVGVAFGRKSLFRVVAATQLVSAASKCYSGPLENLVHGYVHDMSITCMEYCMIKASLLIGVDDVTPENVAKSRFMGALLAFGGASILEFAQRAGYYRGTFDEFDFLAYAAGAGVGYAVDKTVAWYQARSVKKLERNSAVESPGANQGVPVRT